MAFKKEEARVAIIGAGIAGISTAIALKRQLGFDNFVIYEKAGDVGGTWRDNTYPGCGSDIAGHWYSLSTDLNPSWSAYFVSQAEILSYWKTLTLKYALLQHISFNTHVDDAKWDAAAQIYRLSLRNVVTGVVSTEEAEMVVSAAGGLSIPAFPDDIPGRDSYKGELFHSARWRNDVLLSGKRVGVIGNGCSAVQFIPEISKDASVEVVNFCRTPSWFVPHLNFFYPAWLKWAFAHVPLLMRSYRTFVALRYEIRFIAFQKAYKRARATTSKLMTSYIKHKAPEKYHQQLVPTYPPGCKRIVLDNGYLRSLRRPNVSVRYEAIDRVVPDGIRLKTGEVVLLDVIIFATGFDLKNLGPKIIGRHATSLQEYFKSQGGPTAYMGTTMPGFPNFFMLMGPNTATGHASLIFSEESQINYSIQLMTPVINRKAQSFEVRESASREYNADIQRRMAKTVFTECSSWYRSESGSGKNVAMFPGPISLYWWWTLWPRWDDYIAVGAERWSRELGIWIGLKRVLAVSAVGLIATFIFKNTKI